jgi:hypothetical protein
MVCPTFPDVKQHSLKGAAAVGGVAALRMATAEMRFQTIKEFLMKFQHKDARRRLRNRHEHEKQARHPH